MPQSRGLYLQMIADERFDYEANKRKVFVWASTKEDHMYMFYSRG